MIRDPNWHNQHCPFPGWTATRNIRHINLPYPILSGMFTFQVPAQKAHTTVAFLSDLAPRCSAAGCILLLCTLVRRSTQTAKLTLFTHLFIYYMPFCIYTATDCMPVVSLSCLSLYKLQSLYDLATATQTRATVQSVTHNILCCMLSY